MHRLCETDRLVIFKSEPFVISEFYSVERTLYVGFNRDDSEVHTPMAVVTALICTDSQFELAYGWVDWMETASMYRRQGFAMEFLEAISSHCSLQLAGGSDAGEALVESFYCGEAAADGGREA